MNIQTDVTLKTCKDCGKVKPTDEFYPMGKYLSTGCRPCMIERNRKNLLKRDKKEIILNKKIIDNNKVKKSSVKQSLLKEVTAFINKVEKQRGYIDYIDAYRLISLRIDTLGLKFYERVSVEDELILSYSELKKWQKTSLKD